MLITLTGLILTNERPDRKLIRVAHCQNKPTPGKHGQTTPSLRQSPGGGIKWKLATKMIHPRSPTHAALKDNEEREKWGKSHSSTF